MSPATFRLPAAGEAYEWPLGPTTEERFWAKVDQRADDECWPWLACLNGSGYGMLRNQGRMALAHRVAWVIHDGAVPDDLHVLHSCDKPPCVNRAHLYLGTNAENVADKVARGRSRFPQPERRGAGHPMAKLTLAEVLEIRATHTGRRGEGVALAARYGVTASTITAVVTRRIWRHV